MRKIYVIHENSTWVEPLRGAFAARGLPFEEWFLTRGTLDLDQAPPEGVFYNRMSASSYTRDHRFAPEMTGIVLAWLHRHGRRIVNDHRALQLEISKVAQYTALDVQGIRTPRTVAAVGREAIAEAAPVFESGPVLLKPNRGGKGHGVRLFERPSRLVDFVMSDAFEPPIDGVSLLQEYIESADSCITRAEFIGGRFFYAVRVDTSQGFELCPSDHCESDGVIDPGTEPVHPKFSIVDAVDAERVTRYERFLAVNGIEIGAIEFVTDIDGRAYTYDVNTNTNYNTDAERRAKRFGMDGIAGFLGSELAALERSYPLAVG